MRSLFTAVFLSVVGLGCGGADDGGGGTGTEVLVQESQFWEAWRTAACGGYEACCGASQLSFGRSECVAQTRLVYGPSVTVCSKGYAYDPVEGTACLKEIQRTYGECREVRTVDMCSNVCKRSPGNKIVGASCQSSHDCKNPEQEEDGWTICSNGSFDPGVAGTCVFVPRGRVGSTCYASCSGGFCVSATPRPPLTNPAKCMASDGLFCDDENDWTCRPARGPGEKATDSMQCQAGTHVSVSPGTGAVCTPNLPVGSECRNDACEAGSYCENPVSSLTGVCTLFKAAGEACKTNEECAFGCVRNVCLREPGSALDVTAAMCRGEGGLVFD
jgi:hypothetical protein